MNTTSSAVEQIALLVPRDKEYIKLWRGLRPGYYKTLIPEDKTTPKKLPIRR